VLVSLDTSAPRAYTCPVPCTEFGLAGPVIAVWFAVFLSGVVPLHRSLAVVLLGGSRGCIGDPLIAQVLRR
jgi:hypothetical protein